MLKLRNFEVWRSQVSGFPATHYACEADSLDSRKCEASPYATRVWQGEAHCAGEALCEFRNVPYDFEAHGFVRPETAPARA